MLSFTLLAAVSLCSLKTTTLAQIAPMTDVPAGFQIGMSTVRITAPSPSSNPTPPFSAVQFSQD